MKLLVTGANGFIGKNLVAQLKNEGYTEIYEYDINCTEDFLIQAIKSCDFVFHLAGINRPQSNSEFMVGNLGSTEKLLNLLIKHNNPCPVLVTSSIQATLDNPYGVSKKASEDAIFEYGKITGTNTYVYRLPNVFGKWCRPNYNSVVATFCNNIAHDLPIMVSDETKQIELVYIDDVVKAFINTLNKLPNCSQEFCYIPVAYTITLGKLADTIRSFRLSRENLSVPDLSNGLIKKLYSTYLSYLPKDEFSYSLNTNADNRGTFTEFIRTDNKGQVSINISRPGITKGNHWHNSKTEKFLVVSGNGIIRFRKIDTTEIIEYAVSGGKLEVVDIPPGYTHNITNTGDSDMVTVMWANEEFDPANPDTYYMEV